MASCLAPSTAPAPAQPASGGILASNGAHAIPAAASGWGPATLPRTIPMVPMTPAQGPLAWIGRKLLFAAETMTGLFTILTAPMPFPRGRMARTYLRIQARLVGSWLRPGSRTRDRLWGLDLQFASYPIFALLYREIFIDHDYDFETDEPAPRIIDCGAHFGLSIVFFKLRHPRARITAFEPGASVFPILERNIRGNGLQDVELHNVAVAGEDGTVDFFMDGQVLGSMYAVRGDGVDAQVHRVRTVPLSRYIDGPVDFLKIDIEGAENDVLPELARSGALRQVRRMVIEYHHHLDAARDDFSVLLRLLESEGFGYQLKTSARVFPHAREFQDVLISCYRKADGV